ncbi:hypothetical protein [Dinghuibacter silviterrae]|uniref:Uncharacterized protein n=1 Tax=Dinghuibacter silviterrae TaxID=1539049 RepID=A0A4R8DGR7_9BACT|nr:hypothetical protein [Dinghuibacter silviterrae]TDW96434.1 hypothetical protein EDB95_4265 [Dinghuibacter silviterrae]
MKSFLFACLLALLCTGVMAQPYFVSSTLNNQTGGSPAWINMGTLTLPQGGNDAFIRIVGGSGYNAQISQNAIVELHLRTSNGGSLDPNGYGFDATANTFQRALMVDNIKIVPNASGVSATAYTVYAHCYNYVGNSFYTVQASTGSWTATNQQTTDPGTAYVVSFEYFVNSNTYMTGTLGVGTTTNDGYTLAVNGSAIATKMVVKNYANWPDYVFAPDYPLDSLAVVSAYIREHGHLPGVPAASEIRTKGLDLGNMESVLMRKVEELTLYQVEADKKIAGLEARLKALEDTRLSK